MQDRPLEEVTLKPSYNGTIPFTNWTFISWRLFIIFFWWPTSVTPSRLKSLWEKADVGSRDGSGTRRHTHYAPHAPLLLPTSYPLWLPKPFIKGGKFNIPLPPFFFKLLMVSQRGDTISPWSPQRLRGKARQQNVNIGFSKGLRGARGVLFQEKSCVRKRVLQFPLLLREADIWSWVRAARSKVNPRFLPLRVRQSQRYTNCDPTASSWRELNGKGLEHCYHPDGLLKSTGIGNAAPLWAFVNLSANPCLIIIFLWILGDKGICVGSARGATTGKL